MCGDSTSHAALSDATTEFDLHGGHERQEARGAGGNQEGAGHRRASGGYRAKVHGIEDEASSSQANNRGGSAAMNGALYLPKVKKETELCIRQDSVCASARAWRSGHLRLRQYHD